jgi:arylsulfatase A-like enzyme
VVIVVLDAARADHFGCYGYPRDTTPNFDRLAEESLVFDRHYCQYPHTTPSTASLLTSLHPDTHGFRGAPKLGDPDLPVIGPETFTMQKGLEKAGFATFLFTANVHASPMLGLGEDFQQISLVGKASPTWRAGVERGRGRTRRGRGSRETARENSLAVALLNQVQRALDAKPACPFFAYIHFLPPHIPYEAPPEMVALYQGQKPPNYREGKPAFTKVGAPFRATPPPAPDEEWVNIYDANLRWGDWVVGETEAMLKRAGLWDSTLLIITSDHGEALREHEYEHHTSCPYDEALYIPLLIRFPGPKRVVGRVGALTQTVDLLPTIFDLCGTPYPKSQVQGRSLVPVLAGQMEKVNDHVFARTSGEYPCYAVHDQHSALLLYQGGKLRALYDLDTDPGQTRNVIAEQPERAAELAEAFRAFAKTQRYPPLDFVDSHFRPVEPPKGARVELSEETRRQLRSLGYVQ